jgi:hypothetical protein
VFEEIELLPEAILPSPAAACSAVGYPEGAVPPYFLEIAAKAAEDARALSAPRGGFALADADSLPDSGTLDIGGIRLSTGRIIAKEMRGAEEAAVFLCTIGPGPERRVRELLDSGEGSEAFIMDAVASLMAENAAETVHAAVIARAAAAGQGATERYSPGYCGWPVSDQGSLLSLLPSGACGVSLSESSLMRPLKSVSGVIGTGPGLERRGYRCAVCGRKDCPYRNKALEVRGI